MATLFGTKIQDTYDGLLKVTDNIGITGTKKFITDGLGVNSSVKISSLDFEVANFFFIDVLSGQDPSNYKVGINTSSPTQMLHVVGNMRLTGAFYDSNNATGTSGQILSSTASGTDWVDITAIQTLSGSGTANYLTKWTNTTVLGNSILYETSSKIGIGTTSPTEKLHVDGNLALQGQINLMVVNEIYGIIKPEFAKINYYLDDGATTTGTPTITMSGDGHSRLGIGVASPDEALHVVGDALITGDSHADAFKPAVTANPIKFKNFASTELMRITNAGLVGIANNSPSYTLDVTGTARVSGDTYFVTQANSDDSNKVATTAYVKNLIEEIPAGLIFQGTWDALNNTPTLASGTGTTGHFYIVSTDGSTNLDGITDWKVGDWAVFVEQGVTDQWEKIDNSSVLDGSGTGGTITAWAGSGTSNTLTNSPITFSGNDVSFAGNGTFAGDISASNANITTALDVGSFIYVGGNNSIFAENNLRFKSGGAAYIDHNTVSQSIKFRLSNSSSLDVTPLEVTPSYLSSTVDMYFGDNDKIRLGASSDLQIYHDSINSYSAVVDVGTGYLLLGTNGPFVLIGNSTATETYIKANNNGSVDLYFDNSKKFETTSAGIAVTGGGTFTTSVTASGNSNSFGATTFTGDITSVGLTVDYTGNRTGDAGILVTNDASDWGIKVDKDGTADYGILSQTDGENAIVVRNAAGVNKIQLQGDGDATFVGDVTVSGTSSSFNTGNSGTFITNDASNYPRFTMTNASAQLGLFRSGGNAGGMYIGAAGDGFRLYTSSFVQKLLVDQSGNATFAGKILAGTGATASATINAYTTTVSTNLFSALRVIENSSASSYWDIGATGGSSTLLNFYHNATTSPKISFTHTGGATFSGLVGIGLTNPLAKLDVDGVIRSTDNNSGDYLDIYCDGSVTGNSIIENSANNIEIIPQTGTLQVKGDNNNAELEILDSSDVVKVKLDTSGDSYLNGGNLGIGDTTPLAKLEVAGTIKSTNRDVTHTSEPGVTLGYEASEAMAYLETWTSKPLTIRTYNYQAFNISGVEKMRVTSTGLGIGTTLPKTSLDIVKNSDIWHLMVGGLTKKLLVGGQAASGDVVLQAGAASTANNAAVTTAYNLCLQRDGGNVGVANANPQSKLQVAGGIQMANDTDTASASKVGTLKYYTSGNNSYVDMCMQTGATTYEWINIVQNNW